MEAKKLKEGEALMAAGDKCQKTSFFSRWKRSGTNEADVKQTLQVGRASEPDFARARFPRGHVNGSDPW